MAETSASDIDLFFGASEEVRRAMGVLAAPLALTDELATRLLQRSGSPSGIIGALHCSDMVIEVNGEWILAPRVRSRFLNVLDADPDTHSMTHSALVEMASGVQGGSHLPKYFSGPIALAYHSTEVNPIRGESQYARIATSNDRGAMWYAGRLAREQQLRGVLPQNSIPVLFLVAMSHYREGEVDEALPLLRQVARRKETRGEVATALHLLGRHDIRMGHVAEGTKALRRSLRMKEVLRDEEGTAHVLHSLGQALGRDSRRASEAEGMLNRSLDLLRSRGDLHGVAEVLHSLGQAVGRDPQRRQEAEVTLRESIDLLYAQEDLHGVAQVLHSLGQMVGRSPGRRREAESLLQESLRLLVDEVPDKRGEALVLFTLGKVVYRSDPDTASAYWSRSLELNRELGIASHASRVRAHMARYAKRRPKRPPAKKRSLSGPRDLT